MRKGWASMKGFWKEKVPFRLKRSMFICLIQGSALAGLEAKAGWNVPLSRRELQPLDSLMV
eukprot:9953685-Lingulodinium_polyedra.AAC.1